MNPPPTMRQGSPRVARDTLTMAYRGLLRIRRTPEQFLDVVAQPILFTVLFTYLFGGAISGDPTTYLTFLIPGILVQSVVTTCVATGAQLRADMDSGVFDRLRTLPITRISPLSGALLVDTLRYVVAAATTMAAGFVLGYRPAGGIGAVLLAALLVVCCSWALSWVFALLGIVSRTAEAIQGIAIFILYPLTLLSNAFVPVETMPSPLQAFVHANPVTYLVGATRQLLNTGTLGTDFMISILAAILLVTVFAPLSIRAYRRNT